jgi:hypothetical protein
VGILTVTGELPLNVFAEKAPAAKVRVELTLLAEDTIIGASVDCYTPVYVLSVVLPSALVLPELILLKELVLEVFK